MRWLITVLLLLPTPVLALDWSVDAGYFRREYSRVDQLGATGATSSLQLASGQGPSIQAAVGWHSNYVSAGLHLQAAYLFLTGQPKQEYSVKGIDVDTSKLVGPLAVIDAVLGARTKYFNVEVAAGPAIHAVAQRWSKPFDYDLISHVGVKITVPYSRADVCVDIGLFIVPTVKAKNDFDISPTINVTFGTADEPALVTQAPVELAKESTTTETPVKLAAETTPTLPEEPTAVAVAASSTEVVANPSIAKSPLSKAVLHKKAAEHPHKRADENATIRFVVNILKSNPNLDVQIKVGTEFNGALRQRAEEVKKQLLSRGINGKRIKLTFNKGRKTEAKDVKFLFVIRK